MDWRADSEGGREQLVRIVALLLSLATLAERACRAPVPLRFLVIALLRPAERVAWDFVAGDFAMPVPACAGEGYDAQSALCLAESFVALAIALAGYADGLGADGRIGPGLPKAACNVLLVFLPRMDRRAEPFDTS